MAQFLGKELSQAALEAVAQHTSFEAMRDNFSTNYRVVPSNLMDQGISPFMRKGERALGPLWHTASPMGPAQPPLAPQASLVTGRTTSPWPRARASTSSTRRGWQAPTCASARTSEAHPSHAGPVDFPQISAFTKIKVFLLPFPARSSV